MKRSPAVRPATTTPKNESNNTSSLLLSRARTSSASPPRTVCAKWQVATGIRASAGVPADYRVLWAKYKKEITATAKSLGVANSVVIFELKKRDIIAKFGANEETMPEDMSWDETCAFLGTNSAGWKKVLKTVSSPTFGNSRNLPWSNIAPLPARNGDDLFSKYIFYWGGSIHLIAAWMDSAKISLLTKPSCPRRALAFKRFLDKTLARMKPKVQRKPKSPIEQVAPPPVEQVAPQAAPPIVEIAKESSDPWPKGLPRDYEGVSKRYGAYVFDQVKRCSAIKTEDELNEVCQVIWQHILESDVLHKFAATAMSKLPSTMTFVQALLFLGVNLKQFKTAVKLVPWQLRPVQGVELADESLYSTADLETLDHSGFLPEVRDSNRCRPEATERGFKTYLAKAVHNHFKNLIRYRSRRHQERGMDGRVILSASPCGIYQKTKVLDEPSSWEDNIADMSDMPMEHMIDLADAIREEGIDPYSELGAAVLDCVATNKKGLTLKEALESVVAKSKVRSLG